MGKLRIQPGPGTNFESPWDLSFDPQIAVWRLLFSRASWGLWIHWGTQNLNMWEVRCTGGDARECWGWTQFCWRPSFLYLMQTLKKVFHGISFWLKQHFLLWLSLHFVWGGVSCTLFQRRYLEMTDLRDCSSSGGASGLWSELSFRMFQQAIKEWFTRSVTIQRHNRW